MVFALTSTGARATGGGKISSVCSNETVAVSGKRVTLRFVLHGVSCDTGHRLIQTYFHDIAAKTCRGRGTTCIFEYPGGWDCSSPPPSFPISASHRFAVCQIGGRPTASVTVYRATRGGQQSTTPKCASRQLLISLGPESAASGRLALPIRFHDIGARCSLRGYPRVDGLSTSGRVVVSAKPALTGYFGSWRIATITLKNGQTASALLEGVDAAFFAPPPPSSRRLRVTPPNASHSVRLRAPYPLAHLTIHPVVASQSGTGR